LYFDVGTPEAHSIVETSLSLTPKFVSISPSSGSVGGSLITAAVPGVVVGSTVSIVNSTGTSICEIVTVVSYGVIECKTITGEIALTELSIIQDSVTYACVSSSCPYEQSSDSTFPEVTSVSKTDSTIVFTGTNFDLVDFTAAASFASIDADSVVVDSNTQITATFTLGVPTVASAEAPLLKFTSNDISHFAVSATTLANELSVSASSSGLECSFAGGCLFEVTSTGLASLIKNNSTENYVSVCEQPCLFSEEDSSSTVTKCKLP
jgi:hypothetical protein